MENDQINNPAPEQKEQSIFTDHEFSTEGYDKHIRQARNAIFAAAVILLLSVIITISTIPEGYGYLWLDIIIWGSFILGFVALGFWTKKKPYTAIICALVLYGLYIILNGVLDPATLYKGLLVKIIIVVLLVKGINDAKDVQQIRNQIEK